MWPHFLHLLSHLMVMVVIIEPMNLMVVIQHNLVEDTDVCQKLNTQTCVINAVVHWVMGHYCL